MNRSRRSRLTLLRGSGESAPAAKGARAIATGTRDGDAAFGAGSPESDPQAAPAAPRLRLVKDAPQSILLAGGDACRRDALQAELAQRMPEGTQIQQADATWQVLEHAPSSRLVMIAGELDGSPPESVIHLLGSRHPLLPVFALSAPVAG